MNFTHNNHLKYYIGDREFGHRNTSFEKYKVTVGKIDKDYYQTSNYQEELKRIADLVYQDFRKDLVVFLSGGTDSEIVVKNLLSIGVKPHCVTIRMLGYNDYDVGIATQIANTLDLKLTIVDVDIKDYFYSGKAKELSDEIQCSQIAYLMIYDQIKTLSTAAIMGGELLLKRDVNMNPTTWIYLFGENEDASAMRFSLKYNIPLVNEWFSYTPEIMLYYLEDPSITELVTTKYNYKLSSFSSKNRILKKLLTNMELEIRTKTHGFEKLLGFNLEALRRLPENQIQRLESSIDGIPIDTVIEMLRG